MEKNQRLKQKANYLKKLYILREMPYELLHELIKNKLLNYYLKHLIKYSSGMTNKTILYILKTETERIKKYPLYMFSSDFLLRYYKK